MEIAKVNTGNKCPKCSGSELQKARASEAGNVFDLGQKYGKNFDLTYIDKDEKKQYPIMGCFGIGISRNMGIIVETHHDERGIIWPESVAPFKVHLISISGGSSAVQEKADKVYEELKAKGIEVLYDDRVDVGPGQKFADFELIGNPHRVVVSAKTGENIESKSRKSTDIEIISLQKLLAKLQ